MATILSIAELQAWTSITADVQTIENKRLIETVEQRIPLILNNYFVSDDVVINATARFNVTARSITLFSTTEHWDDYGFLAGDYMMIYNSYRNNKYVEISSISDNVAILTSAYSVIDEYHNNSEGKVISFFMVNWPQDVKMCAAEMCYYDYELRSSVGIGKHSPGIRSRSLGPLSESFTVDTDNFGYPVEILSKLDTYKIARCN